MSQFKKFVLSLGLTLTPLLATADCANYVSDIPVVSALCGKGQAECDERVARRFKVKDFEGNWVFTVVSIGGVTGENTIGHSTTSDGQASINKCGIGVLNHYEGVTYAGVPGEIFHFSSTPGVPSLVIELTDPLIGVGSITITDPEIGVVEVVDFVAVRERKTGKVIRLEGHGVSTFPITQDISTYVLIRQDQ
jgi:hypothetical protein